MFQLDQCKDTWDTTFRARVSGHWSCWSQGLVLDETSFDCYKLHSRGPCEEEARLVYHRNETCPRTWCRPYPCPSPTVSTTNGSCVPPHSVCVNQPGKRYEADLWGEYSCQCSASLGFLEMEGQCYPQYLQGPCQEGQHVVRGERGEGECRQDSCFDVVTKNTSDKDWYQGPDGENCKSLIRLFFVRLVNSTSLTKEERMLYEKDPRYLRSSWCNVNLLSVGSCTHCNCVSGEVSKETGDCIETVKVEHKKRMFSFEKLQMFLDTLESETNNSVIETQGGDETEGSGEMEQSGDGNMDSSGDGQSDRGGRVDQKVWGKLNKTN